jgi:hypothetical protein
MVTTRASAAAALVLALGCSRPHAEPSQVEASTDVSTPERRAREATPNDAAGVSAAMPLEDASSPNEQEERQQLWQSHALDVEAECGLPGTATSLEAVSLPPMRTVEGTGIHWQERFAARMSDWRVVDAMGFPAVSDDGSTVAVLEDHRRHDWGVAGRPEFTLRLVFVGVGRGVESSVQLLRESEWQKTLSGESTHPKVGPKTESDAQKAQEALEARVLTRVERAKAQLAARTWLPMSCVDDPNDETPLGGLRVSLDGEPLSLRAVDATGKVRLLHGGAELAVRDSCHIDTFLAEAAVDPKGVVLLVIGAQVPMSDFCGGNDPHVLRAFRLAP